MEKKAEKERNKQEGLNNGVSSTAIGPELPKQLASNSNPASPRPFAQYENDTQNSSTNLHLVESTSSGAASEPELGTRYENMANRKPMNTLTKGYINFVAAREPLVLRESSPEPNKMETSTNSNSNTFSNMPKNNSSQTDRSTHKVSQNSLHNGDSHVSSRPHSPVMIGPALPPEGLPRPDITTSTNQSSASMSHDTNGISQSNSTTQVNQPITSEKTDEVEGDDSDFDMDDIDRQLELALERKEVSTYHIFISIIDEF